MGGVQGQEKDSITTTPRTVEPPMAYPLRILHVEDSRLTTTHRILEL